MTIKEFADLLDMRQYGNEITKAETDQAELLGYVVVFGASDDLCELRGAVDDEINAYNGTTIYIDGDKAFWSRCDPSQCPYLREYMSRLPKFDAIWCGEEFSWSYKIDIPHETFRIYDDTEPYCRGIVFDAKELRGDTK